MQKSSFSPMATLARSTRSTTRDLVCNCKKRVTVIQIKLGEKTVRATTIQSQTAVVQYFDASSACHKLKLSKLGSIMKSARRSERRVLSTDASAATWFFDVVVDVEPLLRFSDGLCTVAIATPCCLEIRAIYRMSGHKTPERLLTVFYIH